MRKIKYLAAVLLFLWPAVMMCGCRPSPALTQQVFDQDETENISDIDQMVENSSENAEQDETIPSVSDDADADRTRDWDNVIAQYGHQYEQTDERAADVEYSLSGSSLYDSPQSETPDETEAAAGGSLDSNLQQSDGTSAQSAAQTDAVVRQDTAGTISPDAEEEDTDDLGSEQDAPHAACAAAVGQTAVLVQQLVGEGSLAAVSQDFAENTFLQQVFADEGAADIPVLWEGDGSSPLSNEDFETLLSLSPDVIFVTEGQQTLSDQQKDMLAQTDGAPSVVTLPDMTDADSILSAVGTIADVFAADNEAAADRAQDYADWYSQLTQTLPTADDVIYTLYLSGWDENVIYRLSSTKEVMLEQQGLPTAVKDADSAVGYFLSLAGVTEKASAAGGSQARTWYVHPFSGLGFNKSIENGMSGVNFNNTNGSQVPYLTEGLGGTDYSVVLAANETIRENIEKSPLWQPNLQLYYTETRAAASDIIGDYSVIVLPHGAADWAAGSAESPLLSLWAAWQFRGTITEEEVRTAITEFYRDFYRCELTEAQLDEILTGGTA